MVSQNVSYISTNPIEYWEDDNYVDTNILFRIYGHYASEEILIHDHNCFEHETLGRVSWSEDIYDGNRHKYSILNQVNSMNWVGPEFVQNADILAAGCSVTHGMGMPFDFSWPNIIKHATGKSVNVVARPGASIGTLVMRIFEVCAQYGWPKELYFLMPDFWRPVTPHIGAIDPRTLNYSKLEKGKWKKIVNYDNINKSKYSIHPEPTIGANLQLLKMLINVCKSTGTKIKLFSWHRQTHFFFQQVQMENYMFPMDHFSKNMLERQSEKMRRYVIENKVTWGLPLEMTFTGTDLCCDLQPHTETQKLVWLGGLDETKESKQHPGMHAAIHFAEIFLQQRIEEDDYRDIKPFWEGSGIDGIRKNW